MKYETVPSLTLPKIGFGTGRFGGTIPNRLRDKHWLAVMRSVFELGYTHIDTAEKYALGYSEELIGRTIRDMGLKREGLFITSKVWPTNARCKKVISACEGSLRRLRTDYIDLYLIHWPNPFIPLEDTFRALNQLAREGKIRRIGVSNFNLQLLKEAQRLSDTPIFADQVPYSIFHRSYARNGVLEYCRQNNIILTAYSPVNHGYLRANKTLRTIANARRVTPHQIALAWLTAQPRVVAIPMSFNPRHQKENLEAVNIELTEAEIAQLNQLG